MTTYNGAAVSDAIIAFKKGMTLQQGRALRDNPIATTEGAAGAPYMQTAWHPYNSDFVGDDTGLLWDFAVSGAVATITTPDFADGYEYRLRFKSITSSNTGLASALQMEAYLETGAAYTSAFNTGATGNSSQAESYAIETVGPRDTKRGLLIRGVFNQTDLSAGVVYGSLDKCLRVRLSWLSAWTFTGGQVFMDRRLVYA